MQIRPGIRLIYQIGRVIVQTSALFLDLDDLSGGRMSRVFVKKIKVRRAYPPPTQESVRPVKRAYRTSRGVSFQDQRKPMPKKQK